MTPNAGGDVAVVMHLGRAFARVRAKDPPGVLLTAYSPHREPNAARAIDDLAVSCDLPVDQPAAEARGPTWERKLSDHAAYTADIHLPAPVSTSAS
jgi:hypothetical protein